VIIKFENISGAGNNIYIDDIQFTGTNLTGVESFVKDNLNMSVSPNPFSSSTQVKFFLVSSAEVSLKVYDVLGREVGNITRQNLGYGEHYFDINSTNTNLSRAGMYFIKLNVNGTEEMKMVTVAQ
jgi:hypothetical protein